MKNLLIISILLPLLAATGQVSEPAGEIAFETKVEQVGDYAQFAPAIASLFLIIENEDKEGFWQFAKSMGANLTTTWTLKYMINKPRPEGRLDGHAFPSGHTSFAFQGASFLQKRYGWKYGIPAYLVAGFVAYSRLEGVNDRHDGWDVLGGILTGIGSTYLFTTEYAQDHYALTFDSNGGDYMLGLVIKF